MPPPAYRPSTVLIPTSSTIHIAFAMEQTPDERAPDLRAAQFRAGAIAAGDRRRQYSDESQAAWHANRKAEAKALSNQSKEAGLEVERLNARAAELIFKSYNPAYPVEGGNAWWIDWLLGGDEDWEGRLGTVDLHGLYVAEAVDRVKKHLERCTERGVQKTTIITGRGLHSQGGVAKIRPEVEKWLRERATEFRVLPGINEGAFAVELVKEQTGVLGRLWKLLGW